MPECSAYKYIYDINRERLGKTALNYYGNKISYQKMFIRIDECASALLSMGVKRGEIVAVSLPNIPEAVYLFYALSKIGAVANMIDPRVSNEGLVNYINETRSIRLFAVDLIAEKIESIEAATLLKDIVLVSPHNSLPPHLKVAAGIKNLFVYKHKKYVSWNTFVDNSGMKLKHTEEVDLSDAPVLIVHTGGTTGLPKGVVLSNGNINAIPFQSLQFPTDLQSKHVWLDIMPPFIAYGIGSGLHFPLAIGQEVVLVPAFKPEELDKLILKYRPNHFAGTPSHWNSLIHSNKISKSDLSFLITCCVGGDNMDTQLELAANKFLAEHNCKYRIAKGYGMTEVNGSIGRTTNENNPIGSVGIPFAHSVVKVCNQETGEELKYNEIGEIYMSGPSVMVGYYNNEVETNSIKICDSEGRYWIKSGDIGHMDEDGNVYIKGRIKRIIIRHDGFKVFPITIEEAICKHPSVKACCVVGKPDMDNNYGKVPIAFVVLNDHSIVENVGLEIQEICRKELPEYAQPVEWQFVDGLPLTPIGKIDYRALESTVDK